MTQEKRGPGRPKTNFKEVTKSTEKGTLLGEERATFIVKSELYDKLKSIAYWERLLIKEVIEEAINDRIKKYEKNHGEIKARPAGKG